MAKAATKKPESKSATLATGTKVSGPSAVVDKVAGKAKAETAANAAKK